MNLIRTNHNATGDPSDAIAPRFDLLNNGAYTYGAIDAKVINNVIIFILKFAKNKYLTILFKVID